MNPLYLSPPPLQVAECKFLHNRLVDVVNFMENIAVKDGVEKVRGRGCEGRWRG